jgi:hypothetical protein
MKTAILIMLATVTVLAAQEQREPLRILKNRKVYLEELQKINQERDDKVKNLTERYLKVLEGVKVAYTKEGNLEAALAAKKEIEGLKPVLGKKQFEKMVKSTGKLEVTRVVLHSQSRAGGTEAGVVEAYLAGKKVWTKEFRLRVRKSREDKVELKLPPDTYADVIKVIPDHDNTRNPGFAEIEIFSGKTNVAPNCEIETSRTVRDCRPAALVDGDTTSDLTAAVWVGVRGIKPWVEFTLPEK